MARSKWTRATYEMVAEVLRTTWVPEADMTFHLSMEAFADQFAADNPLFDRERFYAAARGES